MRVVTTQEAPTLYIKPRELAIQTHSTIFKDSVNATQIYNAPELEKQIIERNYQLEKKDAAKAENHWREPLQLSEKYDEWALDLTRMKREYEFMWNRHMEKITVAKHRTVMNFPDAPPKHSVSYRTDPKQRELERKEFALMKKDGVVEPVVTEWELPIVFVLKKTGRLRFFVEYCQLNVA